MSQSGGDGARDQDDISRQRPGARGRAPTRAPRSQAPSNVQAGDSTRPPAVGRAGPAAPSAFNMGDVAASLPYNSPPSTYQPGQYGGNPTGMPMGATYPTQQFTPESNLPYDPDAAARGLRQQQAPSPYYSTAQGPSPPGYLPQPAYDSGVGPSQYYPIDPRYAVPPGVRPSIQTSPQFMQRASQSPPIPNTPRGPPRKPRQSGHALWVGNLPPAATVTDLKDHFSRDATDDIESVFLISKSNCAFVNYRTEAACGAAMSRFHDSRFNGVRLVCRLRRATSSSQSPPAPTPGPSTPSQSRLSLVTTEEDFEGPVIVGETQTTRPEGTTGPIGAAGDEKVPEKFFIVKSLTVQDLESSVRNGTWATQSHNEAILNAAYEEADNVYLIFSANKSGEYFGFARMASPISGERIRLNTTTTPDDPSLVAGTPQSIPTLRTATAPRGHIIDDSARGTIFWEAERSDDDGSESPAKDGRLASGEDQWGREFKVEWISTARLPFYRTRGLRNPWNANREVKIARDGTQLEPSVGRRLLQMFQRPPQSPYDAGPSSQTGSAYQ